MKSISVTDLKSRLSESLRHIKNGEIWTVTERGRPIAVLSPSAASCDDLESLVAIGAVRLGQKPVPESFWDSQGPEDPAASVRQAVDEERRSGW